MCEFYNALTESQKSSYNSYKNNPNQFAWKLNHSLIENNPDEFSTDIRNLDHLISLNRFNENTTLHRATETHMIGPFIEGGIIRLPYYPSTSRNRGSIKGFFIATNNLVYLEIECSPNFNFLDMECNPQNSDGEDEILLPRNSIFEIIENRVLVEPQTILKLIGFHPQIELITEIEYFKLRALQPT